jgi:hypothetical protein
MSPSRTSHAGASTDDLPMSALFPDLVEVVSKRDSTRFITTASANRLASDSRAEDAFGRTVLPPPLSQLPYLVPTEEGVLAALGTWDARSAQALFADVAAYIAASALLPEPQSAWAELLAAWVFHTLDQEHVTQSPILYMYGPPGHGKSRLGSALLNISFRGVRTVSIRAAHLIRYAEDLAATTFLDLNSVSALTNDGEVVDLLLSRFEKGLIATRIYDPGAGPFKGVKHHSLFGPTIIATNAPIQNPALLSRCISLTMPEASARARDRATTVEDARPLRDRLVAWRAHRMKARGIVPVAKATPGRLGDITRPLLQVISDVAPDRRESVLAVINELALENRAARSQTVEARILTALLNANDAVRNGRLPVKELTDALNSARSGLKLTPHAVGQRLKFLGIQTRTSGGYSMVLYDRAHIEEIALPWLAPDGD